MVTSTKTQDLTSAKTLKWDRHKICENSRVTRSTTAISGEVSKIFLKPEI